MPLSQPPFGGDCLKFWLNTGGSWASGAFLGVADDGSSTLSVNVVPWVAPCPGYIQDLCVFGFANAPSTLHIALYKASPALTPSYSATSLSATVNSGTNTGTDTNTAHRVTVARLDLVVPHIDTTWAVNGCLVIARFIPTVR